VYRVLKAAGVTAVSALAPAGDGGEVHDEPLLGGGDPVLALLTPADLTWLGVTAAEVEAGRLGALRRYRFLGLRSPAGAAARVLFDSGRGSDRFSEWCHADAGEDLPVPGQGLPGHVKDRRMVQLRAEGWRLKDIADALNMSEAGVSRALTRIDEEGPRDENW
jgi:hypothetical protein